MKRIIVLLAILSSANLFAQKADDETTINNMKLEIRNFFVSKGEIDDKNQLEVRAINICDSTDLGFHVKGIYIIRTVYRTDGRDYFFFKNDKKFEILEIKNMKLAISKTLELFNDLPDEKLYVQLQCLLKWYDGSYLAIKKSRTTSKK